MNEHNKLIKPTQELHFNLRCKHDHNYTHNPFWSFTIICICYFVFDRIWKILVKGLKLVHTNLYVGSKCMVHLCSFYSHHLGWSSLLKQLQLTQTASPPHGHRHQSVWKCNIKQSFIFLLRQYSDLYNILYIFLLRQCSDNWYNILYRKQIA
jgi:hypothetical protein